MSDALFQTVVILSPNWRRGRPTSRPRKGFLEQSFQITYSINRPEGLLSGKVAGLQRTQTWRAALKLITVITTQHAGSGAHVSGMVPRWFTVGWQQVRGGVCWLDPRKAGVSTVWTHKEPLVGLRTLLFLQIYNRKEKEHNCEWFKVMCCICFPLLTHTWILRHNFSSEFNYYAKGLKRIATWCWFDGYIAVKLPLALLPHGIRELVHVPAAWLLTHFLPMCLWKQCYMAQVPRPPPFPGETCLKIWAPGFVPDPL